MLSVQRFGFKGYDGFEGFEGFEGFKVFKVLRAVIPVNEEVDSIRTQS